MSKLFRAAAVVAALFLMAGLTAAQDKKKGPGAVSGKIKSVDADKSKITLEGKKNKKDNTTGPDQTFDVAKGAKVTINGEAKTLADVKAGDQATLTLTEDRKSVNTITIGKKKK
jgi:hypothetical protein